MRLCKHVSRADQNGTPILMDIRRLKSFIVIVDSGSITRAADLLHIAQPALSQQLAALEEHFGHKLLIRSQQGVSMTDAGHAVYRHAQIILRQM
ncbi:LysR family transcriptional regulator, partial [Rhizobium leguminosarum]